MSKKTIPVKITPQQRDLEFKGVMLDIQDSMSWPERIFSKIVHNKAIEGVSAIIASTIARPAAILTGGLFALVLSSIIYILAKYYGYPLSNSESIVAFVTGWLIGLLIDLVRISFGKKPI